MRIILLLFFINLNLANAQVLTGTYTIGGSSPDYATFTAAINALELNGVSGPVTFNVRTGTYTESLLLGPVVGSSIINVITFQSEMSDSSLVILTYAGAANTFQCDTGRYITFKEMTVRNTNASGYSAITINKGSNIKVQNCVLQGASGNAGNGFTCLNPDSCIYIQHTRVFNCQDGIFISDNANFSYPPDIRIDYNNVIAGNNAVYIIDLDSVFIKYNYIQGGFRGLLADGVQIGECHHNTFRSAGGQPFLLLWCSDPENGRLLVDNNLMITTNSNQPTNYGCSFTQTDRVEFINNTIYFNSSYNYQSAFFLNQVDSCFIYNNIIVNNGNGYAYWFYSGVNDRYSDHNVIRTNGSLLAPGISNINQWQTTYQLDFNSISVDPQFVNIPNNFHPSNPLVDGLAIPWPGIADDLIGVARHPQYPDPGAYEFSVAPVANLGPDQTICGNSTILSALNNGSYYLWNTGDTTQSINATSTGIYWVRINNLAGTSSDTINVTIHLLPNITISGSNSVCVNDSTQLSVTSPATTFSWSPVTGLDNSNSSIVNASPSSNTTYTIIVTDNFGCSNSDSISITVNPLPIAQAGIDQSICLGAQTTLGTASGMNCSWMPVTALSLPTDCQPIASPASTINYTLTVTDFNGCENSDTVLVTVNLLPAISVCCAQSICENDTASISATASGSNFLWSPAAGLNTTTGSTVEAFPSSTTTYTVTATDAFSCQSSDTVTITLNPLPTISVCCDQTLCNGDTVSLTATSSASNLSWSPSAGLNTTTGNIVNAFPVLSATYTVTATDGNGCTFADVVTLTVNPSPAIPTITQSIGDLISSESTGNQWYLNGNPISGATGQIYTPVQNGNYTVIYTDVNGCSANSTVYFFGSTGIASNVNDGVNCYFLSDDGLIHFSGLPVGKYQLNIYNELGQIILSDVLEGNGQSQEISLSVSNGIFIISLRGDNFYNWKLVLHGE